MTVINVHVSIYSTTCTGPSNTNFEAQLYSEHLSKSNTAQKVAYICTSCQHSVDLKVKNTKTKAQPMITNNNKHEFNFVEVSLYMCSSQSEFSPLNHYIFGDPNNS